jgi:hypothetical protein
MDLKKSPKIQEELEKEMEEAVEKSRARLADQEAALAAIRAGGKGTVIVYLHDLWEDHGGISTTTRSRGELEYALLQAILEYRSKNAVREDQTIIQVTVSVSIEVAGISIPLQETDFLPLFKKLNRSKPGKKQTK